MEILGVNLSLSQTLEIFGVKMSFWQWCATFGFFAYGITNLIKLYHEINKAQQQKDSRKAR
jgi:membrane protease subunit (stomatin/prohibitin family)